MPGLKGQNVVLACEIRHSNLEPAKHEEVAIYAVICGFRMFIELRELFYNGAIRRHHLVLKHLFGLLK